MEVARAVLRIAKQMAVDSVLRHAMHGIAVREIVITGGQERDAWTLAAVYVLAASQSARADLPLIVDASECPLEIAALACEHAAPDSLRPATSRTWMLRLRPGAQSWNGVSLQFALRWPKRSGAPNVGALSIPDHLPRVLSRDVGGRQPTVFVDVAEAGMLVHGLSRRAEQFGPELLHAVLIPAESNELDRPSRTVRIFGRLAREIGPGERERVGTLIGNILDAHATLLGLPVLARVAVVPAEQVPTSAQGALLSIRSVRAFGLAGQPEPDDVMLGSRLVGLWWGTGCRIIGAHRVEMEAALRGASGMVWAERVDGPYRDNVLKYWEQNASQTRVLDWWRGEQGLFRRKLHARWSLALYDAVRQSAEVRDELRRVTRNAWGQFTPIGQLRDAFRRVGLSLD